MHILKIQKELMDISKEQHIQNKDIMELMKGRIKTIEFQTNQFKLNQEIARSFEYLNDRELIRNLQDIDPRKIAQA